MFIIFVQIFCYKAFSSQLQNYRRNVQDIYHTITQTLYMDAQKKKKSIRITQKQAPNS